MSSKLQSGQRSVQADPKQVFEARWRGNTFGRYVRELLREAVAAELPPVPEAAQEPKQNPDYSAT